MKSTKLYDLVKDSGPVLGLAGAYYQTGYLFIGLSLYASFLAGYSVYRYYKHIKNNY